MNAALLLPAALSALAALLLPLLLHLARRSEQRPTPFAALRWLRQKPKPRHRLRFDEWPLLALRVLLLALMALWLAQPVLFGSASDKPWVAVVPGIDAAQVRAAIASEQARAHWLAPGFPDLDQAAPAASAVPFASLLRQLDAELPAAVKLSVVVPEQLQGADAQRPRLSRAVEWKVLPGAMPPPKSVPVPVPALSVRFPENRADQVRYLRAAAIAWQPAANAPAYEAAPGTQALPAGAKNLAWLAPGPLPVAITEWIERGGTALLASDTDYTPSGATLVPWRDEVGAALVEETPLGRGRALRFTRPLTPAEMPELLQADFPRHLRALFAARAPAPSRVEARDYPPTTGGPSHAQAPRDLQPWLALLTGALWLLERLMATRRSRAASP